MRRVEEAGDELYSGGGTRDGMDREKEGGFVFCEGIIKGKNGLRFCIICSVQCGEINVFYCEWVWMRDCCCVSCCCLKLGMRCGENKPVRVYPMASRSPERRK